MIDPTTLCANLMRSAEAWRVDATRYIGHRRAWRLAKADALETRAIAIQDNLH